MTETGRSLKADGPSKSERSFTMKLDDFIALLSESGQSSSGGFKKNTSGNFNLPVEFKYISKVDRKPELKLINSVIIGFSVGNNIYPFSFSPD